MMSPLGTTAETRDAANEAKRFRPTMRLANRSAPWSEERRVTIRILCPLATSQMLGVDDGGDANERPAHQARITLLRALLRGLLLREGEARRKSEEDEDQRDQS